MLRDLREGSLDVVHNRTRAAARHQDLAPLMTNIPGMPSMYLREVVSWAIESLDRDELDAQICLKEEATLDQAAQIGLQLDAEHPTLDFVVELRGSTLLVLRGLP